MFENARRGRQARNFGKNVPTIADLKSSSEQIFSEYFRWVPLTLARDEPLRKSAWEASARLNNKGTFTSCTGHRWRKAKNKNCETIVNRFFSKQKTRDLMPQAISVRYRKFWPVKDNRLSYTLHFLHLLPLKSRSFNAKSSHFIPSSRGGANTLFRRALFRASLPFRSCCTFGHLNFEEN